MIGNMQVSSISAALAISLAPVPVNSIGYSDAAVSQFPAPVGLSLQSIKDQIAYLPIGEATRYMLNIAERMRFHHAALRASWEMNPGPIELDMQDEDIRDGMANIERYIKLSANFIEAVKLVLESLPETEQELKKAIISFGRATAQLRYALEDTLKFIEATHPPKKTVSLSLNVSDDDVHALIRAEHKNLGLSGPNFDSGLGS